MYRVSRLVPLSSPSVANLSKALAASKPESEGEVGLVEDVRISWHHVIPCCAVGAVSALQEEDWLGRPSGEAGADPSPSHEDATVVLSVHADH